MRFLDRKFTTTVPPGFFQEYGPETSISRAVASRYWETQAPAISGDSGKEMFTSITTADVERDFTWH